MADHYASHYERLRRIYAHANPDKLSDPNFLDKTLASFKGTESSLFAALQKKYPEAFAKAEAEGKALAEQRRMEQELAAQKQQQPPPPPELQAANLSAPAPAADALPLSPASPPPGAAAAGTQPSSPMVLQQTVHAPPQQQQQPPQQSLEDYRAQVEEIYRRHNPEKLQGDFLDKTLSAFKGKEHELLKALASKYKCEIPPPPSRNVPAPVVAAAAPVEPQAASSVDPSASPTHQQRQQPESSAVESASPSPVPYHAPASDAQQQPQPQLQQTHRVDDGGAAPSPSPPPADPSPSPPASPREQSEPVAAAPAAAEAAAATTPPAQQSWFQKQQEQHQQQQINPLTANEPRARLERFWQRYAPDRLPEIDGMLQTWAGRTDAMFAHLSATYGPEPRLADPLSASPVNNRRRLTAFWQRYNVARLPLVDSQLELHADDFDAHMRTLVRQHGPEPALPTLTEQEEAELLRLEQLRAERRARFDSEQRQQQRRREEQERDEAEHQRRLAAQLLAASASPPSASWIAQQEAQRRAVESQQRAWQEQLEREQERSFSVEMRTEPPEDTEGRLLDEMPGLSGHSAVAFGSTIIVYGGLHSPTHFNRHCFALDLESEQWSKLRTSTASPVYQPLFGNGDGTNLNFLSSSSPQRGGSGGGSGAGPLPRAFHSAVMVDNRMYVFGGLLCVGIEDVHYNRHNVIAHPDAVLAAREDLRGRPHKARDRLVPECAQRWPRTQRPLEPSALHVLEVSEEDGSAVWCRVAAVGSEPPARAHHAACVVDGTHMYVYGGYSVYSHGMTGDPDSHACAALFCLNVQHLVWRRVETAHAPWPARWGAASALTPDQRRWYFVGGVDPDAPGETNDVFVLDLPRREWTKVQRPDPEVTFGPDCTAQQAAVSFGGKLYVMQGGCRYGSALHEDFKAMHESNGAWETLHEGGSSNSSAHTRRLFSQTAGYPPARSGHAAVVVGYELYVVGGLVDAFHGHRSRDVFCFNFLTQAWRKLGCKYVRAPDESVAQRSVGLPSALEAVMDLSKQLKYEADHPPPPPPPLQPVIMMPQHPQEQPQFAEYDEIPADQRDAGASSQVQAQLQQQPYDNAADVDDGAAATAAVSSGARPQLSRQRQQAQHIDAADGADSLSPASRGNAAGGEEVEAVRVQLQALQQQQDAEKQQQQQALAQRDQQIAAMQAELQQLKQAMLAATAMTASAGQQQPQSQPQALAPMTAEQQPVTVATAPAAVAVATVAAAPVEIEGNHRERLMRFYQHYNSEKATAEVVDSALARYVGNEHLLWKQLTQRYGPEPPAPTAAAATAVAAPPATLAAARAQVDPVQRERLMRFYRHYCAEKATVESVDGVLARYTGNEQALWDQLLQRYGPEPAAVASAGTAAVAAAVAQPQLQRAAPAPAPAPEPTPVEEEAPQEAAAVDSDTDAQEPSSGGGAANNNFSQGFRGAFDDDNNGGGGGGGGGAQYFDDPPAQPAAPAAAAAAREPQTAEEVEAACRAILEASGDQAMLRSLPAMAAKYKDKPAVLLAMVRKKYPHAAPATAAAVKQPPASPPAPKSPTAAVAATPAKKSPPPPPSAAAAAKSPTAAAAAGAPAAKPAVQNQPPTAPAPVGSVPPQTAEEIEAECRRHLQANGDTVMIKSLPLMMKKYADKPSTVLTMIYKKYPPAPASGAPSKPAAAATPPAAVPAPAAAAPATETAAAKKVSPKPAGTPPPPPPSAAAAAAAKAKTAPPPPGAAPSPAAKAPPPPPTAAAAAASAAAKKTPEQIEAECRVILEKNGDQAMLKSLHAMVEKMAKEGKEASVLAMVKKKYPN